MPRLDQIATGEKIGNAIDEAVTFTSGATTAATPAYRMPREDSGTNTAPPVLALRRTSSGTPANGIGGSLDFEVETAAGNIEVGGQIACVTSDVTATSEDFFFSYRLMIAGAVAAEILRISGSSVTSSVPLVGAASATVPGLQLAGGTGNGTGLRYNAPSDGGLIAVEINGSDYMAFKAGKGFIARAGDGFVWSSTAAVTITYDTGLMRSSAGVVEANNGTAGTYRDFMGRKYLCDQTITAGGTTGDRTIDKAAGTVNIAVAGITVTVTSNQCTTSSTVHAVIRTNDTTAVIKNVVPGSGSFVITLNAAATAEISIGWLIIN